jgi:hypothetical protein
MKQPHSFDQTRQEQFPAGGSTTLATTSFAGAAERFTTRQRTGRLFQMGELAAAADHMVEETIQ